MPTNIISLGLSIDGGYYCWINGGLYLDEVAKEDPSLSGKISDSIQR